MVARRLCLTHRQPGADLRVVPKALSNRRCLQWAPRPGWPSRAGTGCRPGGGQRCSPDQTTCPGQSGRGIRSRASARPPLGRQNTGYSPSTPRLFSRRDASIRAFFNRASAADSGTRGAYPRRWPTGAGVCSQRTDHQGAAISGAAARWSRAGCGSEWRRRRRTASNSCSAERRGSVGLTGSPTAR